MIRLCTGETKSAHINTPRKLLHLCHMHQACYPKTLERLGEDIDQLISSNVVLLRRQSFPEQLTINFYMLGEVMKDS